MPPPMPHSPFLSYPKACDFCPCWAPPPFFIKVIAPPLAHLSPAALPLSALNSLNLLALSLPLFTSRLKGLPLSLSRLWIKFNSSFISVLTQVQLCLRVRNLSKKAHVQHGSILGSIKLVATGMSWSWYEFPTLSHASSLNYQHLAMWMTYNLNYKSFHQNGIKWQKKGGTVMI